MGKTENRRKKEFQSEACYVPHTTPKLPVL